MRDNILNVAGVADAAKNVTIEHTAKTDYWLTKALFDGSTAGMLLSSIQVGEHVIWQDQSGAGLPVSAFVAAAQNSFALGGKRLQRNEQLLIRAVAASASDTLRVQFGVKQRISAGRC